MYLIKQKFKRLTHLYIKNRYGLAHAKFVQIQEQKYSKKHAETGFHLQISGTKSLKTPIKNFPGEGTNFWQRAD